MSTTDQAGTITAPVVNGVCRPPLASPCESDFDYLASLALNGELRPVEFDLEFNMARILTARGEFELLGSGIADTPLGEEIAELLLGSYTPLSVEQTRRYSMFYFSGLITYESGRTLWTDQDGSNPSFAEGLGESGRGAIAASGILVAEQIEDEVAFTFSDDDLDSTNRSIPIGTSFFTTRTTFYPVNLTGYFFSQSSPPLTLGLSATWTVS